MKALKFAVIGTGRFGKHYVRLVNDIPEIELVATADSSSNLEELFASSEIDCVIIATPASTHFEIATKALEAGKHVLLEKPMVLSVSDAEALRDVVKKSGKTFMVGHQYLYNDHIRYLKSKIESGELGKVEKVEAVHHYPGPVREDTDVFWDAAPHELSIMDYLFGSIDVTKIDLDLSATAEEKVHTIKFIGDHATALYDDLLDPKLVIDGKEQIVEAREPLRAEVEHFIECVQKNKVPVSDIEHGTRVVKALEIISKSIGAVLK